MSFLVVKNQKTVTGRITYSFGKYYIYLPTEFGNNRYIFTINDNICHMKAVKKGGCKAVLPSSHNNRNHPVFYTAGQAHSKRNDNFISHIEDIKVDVHANGDLSFRLPEFRVRSTQKPSYRSDKKTDMETLEELITHFNNVIDKMKAEPFVKDAKVYVQLTKTIGG